MDIISRIQKNRPINYDYFLGIHSVSGWTRLHDKAYDGTLMANDIENLTASQIDITDGFGQSALFWAVEAGHYDIVKLLLSKGANPKQTDNLGRTLFHILTSVKLVDLLLSYDVAYEQSDIHGKTAIDELSTDEAFIMNSETSDIIVQRETILGKLIKHQRKNQNQKK